MKKFILMVLSVCFIQLFAAAQTPATKTEKVKIYGNCEMCKASIEGALKKKDGVISRNWDETSKMLTVTYDPTKITMKKMLQKIADVGYDSDSVRATAERYNKLPKCCKYDRPKQ